MRACLPHALGFTIRRLKARDSLLRAHWVGRERDRTGSVGSVKRAKDRGIYANRDRSPQTPAKAGGATNTSLHPHESGQKARRNHRRGRASSTHAPPRASSASPAPAPPLSSWRLCAPVARQVKCGNKAKGQTEPYIFQVRSLVNCAKRNAGETTKNKTLVGPPNPTHALHHHHRRPARPRTSP